MFFSFQNLTVNQAVPRTGSPFRFLACDKRWIGDENAAIGIVIY
jgi:hypothetical protein